MTSYSLLFSDNKICSEKNKSIVNFPNKHHLTFTYQINDTEKTYYFSHNIENHEFYIQEIIDKNMIITESGRLNDGYELGFPFQVNRQTFYYAQNNQTKHWFIQELLAGGKLGEVTDRGQWLNVYQVIFSFQLSSSIKAYYFGHNTDSNYWFIQELLEGGKLGLEICNGHWETPCHVMVPFKIKNKSYFYSHNLDNCDWNIQELLLDSFDKEADGSGSKMVIKVDVIDKGRLKKPFPLNSIFRLNNINNNNNNNNNRTVIFSYNKETKFWFIQGILSNGKMGTKITNGTFNYHYDSFISFSTNNNKTSILGRIANK